MVNQFNNSFEFNSLRLWFTNNRIKRYCIENKYCLYNNFYIWNSIENFGICIYLELKWTIKSIYLQQSKQYWFGCINFKFN